jgi:hypothetical protein
MQTIQAEIRRAAESLGACIHELPRDKAGAIMQTVAQRFTPGVRKWPLWTALTNPTYADNPFAWAWVGEFVGKAPVYLLFNDIGDHDRFRGFEFEDGSQVVPVMEKCDIFEFYLTNQAADYLICFSHQEILYATGTAKPWLQAKQLR